MLTLQEISDRIEIQEALVKYTYAVDRHDWELLDEVFTPDAKLDYSEIANWTGDRAGIKEWLSNAMPEPGTYQHLTATPSITINGDSATSRIICYNPMPRGEGQFSLFGHWYRDQWVRTPEGWRIRERYFETCYNHPLKDVPADIG